MWLEVEYILENNQIVEEEKDIYGDYLAKISLEKDEFSLEEIPKIEVAIFEKNKEDLTSKDSINKEENLINETLKPIVKERLNKLNIKLKVLNSNKEVVYKTEKYFYNEENNSLNFDLFDFNFYPGDYIIKIYVNNLLAGESNFKITGEIIKKEVIDSNQYIVFIKNKEKYSIWFLEENEKNSWEKIYEGNVIPIYSIKDNYILYVLDNTLYGYSLEGKTVFSQSLELESPTVIYLKEKKYELNYFQESLILNEVNEVN